LDSPRLDDVGKRKCLILPGLELRYLIIEPVFDVLKISRTPEHSPEDTKVAVGIDRNLVMYVIRVFDRG
jgi:hypothetical protein